MSSNGGETKSSRRIVVVLLFCIGFVFACWIGAWLTQLLSREGGEGVVPTPTAVSIAANVNILASNGNFPLTTTVSLPTAVRLNDRTFGLEPQTVSDGLWRMPTDPNRAAWLYGSIINYTIGVPYSNQTESLFDEAVIGDEIVLRLRDNRQLIFTVASKLDTPSNSQDLFPQNKTGITLLLIEEDQTINQLLYGQYIVQSQEDIERLSADTNTLNLQLGTLAVELVNNYYEPFTPQDVPVGFLAYQVEFRLLNTVSETVFSTSQLQTYLVDQAGNRYSEVEVSPPEVDVFPQQRMIRPIYATYHIPTSLVGSTMFWVVLREDTRTQGQLLVAVDDSNANVANIDVKLQDVTLSPSGDSLILEGTVTNAGQSVLFVSEGDVTLFTDDETVYFKQQSSPPFPWRVDANEAISFSVSFTKPKIENRAIFSVFKHAFQVDGFN